MYFVESFSVFRIRGWRPKSTEVEPRMFCNAISFRFEVRSGYPTFSGVHRRNWRKAQSTDLDCKHWTRYSNRTCSRFEPWWKLTKKKKSHIELATPQVGFGFEYLRGTLGAGEAMCVRYDATERLHSHTYTYVCIVHTQNLHKRADWTWTCAVKAPVFSGASARCSRCTAMPRGERTPGGGRCGERGRVRGGSTT